MGMLFNTPDTIEMCRLAHAAFAAHWATFQGAPRTYEPIFRALGTGGVSSYTTLSGRPLLLTHPTKNSRWQTWLGLLDTAGVSQTIGGHIADAIHNNARYSGVEFHLLPDANITASQFDLPDQDPTRVPGTTYTSVILIKTVTWDNVHP